MKFIHIRKSELLKVRKIGTDQAMEYELKSGLAQHGGITLAYNIEVVESTVHISLAACYCGPKRMFDRKGGNRIAADRLRTQPLQFQMPLSPEGKGVPTIQTVASMFHVFLMDRERAWFKEGDLLHPTRFTKGEREGVRLQSEFLGPDGIVIIAAIDSRVRLADFSTDDPFSRLRAQRAEEQPSPRGWLSSTPNWVFSFFNEVIG